MSDLSRKSCLPCEGGTTPIAPPHAKELMAQIPGWTLEPSAKALSRTFQFKDFYETMAFVNAIAYIAHREDHHPDLAVGYKTCGVNYHTHAIDGLSENDFICAAKIDALVL